MTERVTASTLTEGARVLVARDTDGDPVLAKAPEAAEVATVTAIAQDGRKLVVDTDLGAFAVGPTAKILLAPPAEVVEQAPPAPPVPAGLTEATVTLDAAGRMTPDSVVTVGERSARVPARDEHLPTAPARLLAALSSIGFEPVTSWALTNGAATCKVRPNRP